MGRQNAEKDPRMSLQSLKVLRAFIADPMRQLSGADIAKMTRLASGTLYPILFRLETAGWLKSAWEKVDPSEVGRPRRRLYTLTGVGQTNALRNLDAVSIRDDRRHFTGGALA